MGNEPLSVKLAILVWTVVLRFWWLMQEYSAWFLRVSEDSWFGDGACSDTRGICSGHLRLRHQVGEPPFQQPPSSQLCCCGCVLLLSACALDVSWALAFLTMYFRMIFWDSMHQPPPFNACSYPATKHHFSCCLCMEPGISSSWRGIITQLKKKITNTR